MRITESPVINKELGRGSLGSGEENRTKEQREQQMQICSYLQFIYINTVYGIIHTCPTVQLEPSAGYCLGFGEGESDKKRAKSTTNADVNNAPDWRASAIF
ncbi:hypothetical protein CEXT_433281 [Caerostris extrusa]|uniref:Uncharacterized protein n=1 Tax=Caerostris extrusa TaxID=172846 RepID=A0AAV4R0H2_CAEEX|nr:hypothetical protein CEXT_433281 [Caerostris extrusa]